MLWDLVISLIYLMSYVLDPIVFAFKFTPLDDPLVNRFSLLVTYMIILDIFIVPITGVAKEDQDLPERLNKKQRREKKKLRILMY